MVTTKTFPSGLRLVVKPIDGLLSVTTGVLVGAGSGSESAEENGISHFLEHMSFKGTDKRTAFEISDGVDRIGAQINAFTTKELTCYYLKSTADHLAEGAEILADLFFRSNFREDELERERGVILEEIAMEEDTPEDLCLDLLAEAHFGPRGFGAPILGPAENVRRISQADLRAYRAARYAADNTVICIAGNVDPAQAEDLAEELFEREFVASGRRTSDKRGSAKSGGMARTLAREKDVEQTHLAVGFPSYALDDPRNTPLALVNAALGGGMSSRLFQTVREKMGACYSIYSYVSTYRSEGALAVYAAVNPKNAARALDAVAREIGKLQAEGISADEFSRGKEQLKGAFTFGQESTSSQMLLYGKYLLLTGKIFDFDGRIAAIDAVTEEEVRAAIGENFDFSRASLATVGRKGAPLSLKK